MIQQSFSTLRPIRFLGLFVVLEPVCVVFQLSLPMVFIFGLQDAEHLLI
jgi:hypothetical protein